jgi:hypothetical protein
MIQLHVSQPFQAKRKKKKKTSIKNQFNIPISTAPLDENSIRSHLTPHASLPTDPIDPALAAASPPHPQPQSSSTTSHSHHALAKLQSVKTSQTHPMKSAFFHSFTLS